MRQDGRIISSIGFYTICLRYYLPTVLSAYGFAVLRGFFAELPQTPQDGESAEANSGSDPAYHYRPPRGQPALPAIKVTCRYMSKTSHPRNKLPKWHKIWKATQSLQYMLLWAKLNVTQWMDPIASRRDSR
jgi:hypothetical protein